MEQLDDPTMTGKPEEIPNNENGNDAEQAANDQSAKGDDANDMGKDA